MNAQSSSIFRSVPWTLFFVYLLLYQGTAIAQDFHSFFRGDEVGPREFHFDGEVFLNVLSFEQPLESVQPWLASNSGYRLALGSLTGRDLWLEHQVKALATVSDRVKVRVMVHQGVDMDEPHLFLQPVLEYSLDEKNALLAPFVLDGDKGNLGGGLGWCYRNPEDEIDYLQFTWLRSNALFENRSREFKDSEVRKPADTFEMQFQGSAFDLGLSSLKIAYQTHGEIKYEQLGRDDEYRRFSAWFLHRYDIDDRNRFFFQFDQDSAAEQIDPFMPKALTEEFRGERDLGRFRLEYQRDLEDESPRRVRGGIQHVRYREREYSPFDLKELHKIDRSELIFYAGYRCPLGDSETLSLETVTYFGSMNNHNDYPYDSHEDGSDPTFQGKACFHFHWAVNEDVDFVLIPSFELDKVGWGGGGLQIRYHF